MYVHELSEWPNFRWDQERLTGPLAEVRLKQGRVLGRLASLGFAMQQQTVLDTLTLDVLKSSEIEGERLDAEQVRSSIARKLGMEFAALPRAERDVEGVVEMMLDATGRHNEPLTAQRLYRWHRALFPTGQSGLTQIVVGAWRDDRRGPMQVVSGPVGKERVHFRAPGAERLEGEMRRFLDWFEGGAVVDPLVKAGLAHLWFVTVHPFEDGNGRMARAIGDLALARSEGSSQRYYSMSAQIRVERQAYYENLERTQRGSMDVTLWLDWFVGCLGRAIDVAEAGLVAVTAKARFWDRLRQVSLNDRQRLVLNRLLDGYEGKLSSGKYAGMAKCSTDTALRDIEQLIEVGALERSAGRGRGTSYVLKGLES
jgi:Fic family protein